MFVFPTRGGGRILVRNLPILENINPFQPVLRSRHYLYSAPALHVSIISAPAPAPATAIYCHLKLYYNCQGCESGSAWIRIHFPSWIRIGILKKFVTNFVRLDPDPDPHLKGCWIRLRIEMISWIQIRIRKNECGSTALINVDCSTIRNISPVLRNLSRWSRNYFRPGARAGAEIISLINIY